LSRKIKGISTNEYIAIALILQVLVLLIRLVGFFLLKNYALLFESFHVAGDILVTGMVLVSIKVSSSAFSRRYSYGLYRIEDLVSLFIAAIIVFTALDILITLAHSIVGSSFDASLIEFISIIPLFFSGNVKIIAGKMAKSPALSADGHHNYSDVYVGVGVGVGLFLFFLTGISLFYYVAVGFAVIAILYTAFTIGKDSITGIMDLPKDRITVPKIDQLVRENQNVKDVTSVKARWAGPAIFVEIVLRVNSRLTIEEAHDVADDVERVVRENIDSVRDVVIHIEPSRERRREIIVPLTPENKISDKFSKSTNYLVISEENGKRIGTRNIEIPFEAISQEKNAERVLEICRENKITDAVALNTGEILFSLLSTNHIIVWSAISDDLNQNLNLFLSNQLKKFIPK
jgi:cation diffusion facilitator family transporter